MEAIRYKTIADLIHKHGTSYKKKHGNHIIIQGEEEYLALDTWNGYINLIEGVFSGNLYASTFDKGKLMLRKIPGRDAIASRENTGRAYQFILNNVEISL